MATPYFQFTYDSVPSTQDVAREKLEDLPVLVVASAQSRGRGRTGSEWLTAPKAVAASFAYRHDDDDTRPVSLVAGVAAVRSTVGLTLKWPNDVLREGLKVGGILVERSGDITVAGLGMNLWWPEPPEGIGSVFDTEPAENVHLELGALWGAELARLLDEPGWPIDEYRSVCQTIGRQITWEPGGSGVARDVTDVGGLVVDTDGDELTIHSGAVRHIR